MHYACGDTPIPNIPDTLSEDLVHFGRSICNPTTASVMCDCLSGWKTGSRFWRELSKHFTLHRFADFLNYYQMLGACMAIPSAMLIICTKNAVKLLINLAVFAFL